MPNILKPFLGIAMFLLIPSLGLFLFLFIGSIVHFHDKTYPRGRNRDVKNVGCFKKHAYNRKGDRKCRLLGFILIWFPFWTIISSICLIISVILFALAVLPAYILAIVVFMRMLCWWCKNKRINVKKNKN